MCTSLVNLVLWRWHKSPVDLRTIQSKTFMTYDMSGSYFTSKCIQNRGCIETVLNPEVEQRTVLSPALGQRPFSWSIMASRHQDKCRQNRYGSIVSNFDTVRYSSCSTEIPFSYFTKIKKGTVREVWHLLTSYRQQTMPKIVLVFLPAKQSIGVHNTFQQLELSVCTLDGCGQSMRHRNCLSVRLGHELIICWPCTQSTSVCGGAKVCSHCLSKQFQNQLTKIIDGTHLRRTSYGFVHTAATVWAENRDVTKNPNKKVSQSIFGGAIDVADDETSMTNTAVSRRFSKIRINTAACFALDSKWRERFVKVAPFVVTAMSRFLDVNSDVEITYEDEDFLMKEKLLEYINQFGWCFIKYSFLLFDLIRWKLIHNLNDLFLCNDW